MWYRRDGEDGVAALPGDVPRGMSVKPAARAWLVLALSLVAGCGRDSDGARRSGPVARPFDPDSAARGLLAPELGLLLAVEPMLAAMGDTGRRVGRRCRVDTLPQLRHVRLRFDARSGDTTVTLFARRTPDGVLRRTEILRRLPDGTALGATWDASEGKTTVTQFGGGRATQTTSRDVEAPLARSLQYVGRRALGTQCGKAE